MQTRTITVDYARPRGYDVGYRAENNFTLLALPIPAELEGADSYRVYFESTVGEYLQTELLTPADGYVTVKITSDVVPEPGNMAAQLVAFSDGEIVGYAPMITGSAKVSIPDGAERLSHSLSAEIALNTAARHSHENKAVLDKFAETDGKPTYGGQPIGGGSAGNDGTTFVPSVSADGVLSWRNDGGLENPSPVNIKGDKGDTGTTPSITIGTVSTLEAGSNATATISGTTEQPALNFGIPKGADGKTPVKGTDYWTAADKAEIVNDTLAALPTWTGGSY